MKVCAITNVYNETHNLPIWYNYFSEQVGVENVFVIDHGSTDGSTDKLDPKTNKLVLPRHKPFKESYCFELVNNLVNDLTNYYDWVIYSDADEIIVADPVKYNGLINYLEQTDKDTCYAIGLNLRHLISTESPLEPGDKILKKRSTAQFVSGMCKPLITRKPLRWLHGFHGADVLPTFDDLYLFHLRHADMDWARARMDVTRKIEFADRTVERYSLSDEELIRREYESVETKPIDEKFHLSGHLKTQMERYEQNAHGVYRVLPPYLGRNLHRIPERFQNLF